MTKTTSAKQETDAESQWLSLGPAARFLGVSEVTLRHWADAGRIRSYRTVGSHRRFARQDLLLLLQERVRPARVGDLESEALQRLRRRLHSPHSARPGLDSLDEEARSRLRVLGRRVVEIAVRFHQDPRRRPALREEARFVGADYAAEALRLGLTLSRALESFLFHRTALIDTVRPLAPAEASREDVLELWRNVAELTDTVQLALVEAYEHPHGASQAEARADSGLSSLASTL
ncbi:MAG: helix-turn-helix domain-containing protein [Chloroflexi bacterium]|nr:helix-turn-helix domain-containing protein [Chloroflexota bacterium]